MKVCWISAGVSSFIAGYIERCDFYIYIDVKDQHPDSLRFIDDCERALDHEILRLKSERYDSTEDVFRARRFINSPAGAPCTKELKKYVRKKWENEFLRTYGIDEYNQLTYIWGYDANEKLRAEHMIQNFPDFNHHFPLIDANMSKSSVHGYFDKHFNFKRPIMYDLGYNNNNCIGCVKGSAGYWNKIRIDFPDVFKARCELERDLNKTCINGIFLDELSPDAGRGQKIIIPDCDIFCQLSDFT